MIRKTPLAMAAAGVLTLGLGACSDEGPTVSQPATPSAATTSAAASSTTTPPPSTTEPSPTTTETPTSSAPGPLKAGECLGPAPDYERVACTEAHTYEIFFTKKDGTHGNDLLKRSAWSTATCNTEGAKFLGNEGFFMSRVGVAPVPSSVNTDATGTIACMTQEIRTSGRGLVSSTTSLKGTLKGDAYHAYTLCIDGKASATEIKVVVCSQPHTSQVIGGKINGKAGDPYPKDGSTIHANARKVCAPMAKKFLGGTRSDLAYAENSGGRGPWERGKMFSACFVETKDGSKVTKSLKGIGKKPLSQYK